MIRRELQQDAGRWRPAAGHILPLILTTSTLIPICQLQPGASPRPRPAPAPDTDYQIFVGRGPSTQEPGARGVGGSDRRHSFLNDAMRKRARLIFKVLGMLQEFIFCLWWLFIRKIHTLHISTFTDSPWFTDLPRGRLYFYFPTYCITNRMLKKLSTWPSFASLKYENCIAHNWKYPDLLRMESRQYFMYEGQTVQNKN